MEQESRSRTRGLSSLFTRPRCSSRSLMGTAAAAAARFSSMIPLITRRKSPQTLATHFPTTPPARCSSTAPPIINPTSLRSRLASGRPLFGLFLLSNSPALAEIAGLAGYDYVILDMEHGPGGISTTLHTLRALSLTHTPAVIRLPDLSLSWAKKALDLGPHAVMFPMIESAAAAQLAVSYCRFPPKGVRGSAHTAVRASAYGFDDGYLQWCEDEMMVMCQVESAAGVDAIEGIAAVDGVGCIQIGPRDLSASMGCLHDPGNERVRGKLMEAERRAAAAIERVRGGAGAGAGPYLAGMVTALDGPGDLVRRGYDMVASGVDLALFRSAAVEDLRRLRAAAEDANAEQQE